MPKTLIFDHEHAVRFTRARQDTLRWLLPQLDHALGLRTAIDVGCGVGYFSSTLREFGLDVRAVDARPENIAEAQGRFPEIGFSVCNVEERSSTHLGCFDLVLCFGLIYHLENPFRAVRNLSAITGKVLLLESLAVRDSKQTMLMTREDDAEDQSLTTVAFYPSEQCLVDMCYAAGFTFVYRVNPLPDHEEFRSSLGRKRRRTLLLAARKEMGIPSLALLARPAPPRDPWAAAWNVGNFVDHIRRFLRAEWPERRAIIHKAFGI